MMSTYLSFGALGTNSAYSTNSTSTSDRPGILNLFKETFIAFSLILQKTTVPQEKDISDLYSSIMPNVRATWYSFNNIATVTIFDDPADGSVTYSLSVAMSDALESLEPRELFAAFLADCSNQDSAVRMTASETLGRVCQNIVDDEDFSVGKWEQGQYIYSVWMSHTDSEIFFEVKVP